MTKPKWTPGPWAVEKNVKAGGVTHLAITARHDKSGWMPCSVTPMVWARETDYANAHLIAAAPSLYEALGTLLEVMAAYVDIDDVCNADITGAVTSSRQALAKARGETP